MQGSVDRTGSHGVEADPSFAYSIASRRVTVFKPPFVITETEALTPAIGLSASAPVIVTTLPDLRFNICLTASWVMYRNSSRLTEAKALKSSVAKSVSGFV